MATARTEGDDHEIGAALLRDPREILDRAEAAASGRIPRVVNHTNDLLAEERSRVDLRHDLIGERAAADYQYTLRSAPSPKLLGETAERDDERHRRYERPGDEDRWNHAIGHKAVEDPA